MRLIVKDNTALERDQKTNAILNNDSIGYQAALLRKKYNKKTSEEIKFSTLPVSVSKINS